MTKKELIVEHVVVTFVEAAVAYLIVIPTVNWSRTIFVGAIGAGLSAVYNLLRQSTPTLPATSPAETVTPSATVIQPTQVGQGSGPDGNPLPGHPG